MSIVRGMGAKVAAGGVLAMLALSGCSATESPAPGASPRSRTPTPLFANEQEALAAATKAYEAYQAMGDLIFSQGGKDGSRIFPLVSEEFAQTEMKGFEQARSNGWHSVGASSFDGFTIQEVNETAADGNRVITAYLCSDTSEVDVLNPDGISVVSKSRTKRTPFQVTFDVSTHNRGVLVVGSRTMWSGDGVC